MTRIEMLERIIEQKGGCEGIDCYKDKCPLLVICRDSDMCGNYKEILKATKEMLVLEKEKEQA